MLGFAHEKPSITKAFQIKQGNKETHGHYGEELTNCDFWFMVIILVDVGFTLV